MCRYRDVDIMAAESASAGRAPNSSDARPGGFAAVTSQQQLNAFLAHCTAIRAGKLYGFKKKSSSLRNFIAALEQEIKTNKVKPMLEEDHNGVLATLRQSSPKDHVKYLPALQSLAAVWGSTRNYVPLPANTVQPVTTLYFDLATGTLGNVPTKISSSSRYAGYHQAVATHLTALDKIAAGHTVLDAFANSTTHNVSIVDHSLSNQCGANGSLNGMNNVARELYDGITVKLGDATKTALRDVPKAGKTQGAWLAAAINQTPRYQLKGNPATTPCNLGVTEGQVNAWVGGQPIWQDYGNDPDLAQIKNAIIVALYEYADAGTGCNSTVNYTLGTSNPNNAERPPAIGLAHELIHAYYNLKGWQPGFEVDNPTTVLFEYRCVGLGPWKTKRVSENGIRRHWTDALLHFDDDDTRNRLVVGQRPYYSPP